MTHEQAVQRWLKADGVGVEIGAFKSPVPGIKPIYVDRFSEFAGEPCFADYWGDACHLPFHSDSLDYVVTSHVLEHVANPVAALVEWHRVLRSGGIIYLVVPDRRFTFDHTRELTDPEHMWADYLANVTQCDEAHINEFVERVDWTLFAPGLTPEAARLQQIEMKRLYHGSIRARDEINIHFHVFEPTNLRTLVSLTGKRLGLSWKIVEQREHFPAGCPNGILLVIRVRKHGLAWWRSQCSRWRGRADPGSVVRADARPLSAAHEMRQADRGAPRPSASAIDGKL